jgi:hypothetical protein
MIDYYLIFNTSEGLFWIVLAACAYRYRDTLPRIHLRYWESLALILFIFGISDWVEVYSPIGFLEPGGEWLLSVKIFCVAWMIIAGIQYFRLRM